MAIVSDQWVSSSFHLPDTIVGLSASNQDLAYNHVKKIAISARTRALVVRVAKVDHCFSVFLLERPRC